MRPQAPRPTGQEKAEKRTPQVGMVDGLNVARLQSEIQWRGMVRLHQLNEDDRSGLPGHARALGSRDCLSRGRSCCAGLTSN